MTKQQKNTEQNRVTRTYRFNFFYIISMLKENYIHEVLDIDRIVFMILFNMLIDISSDEQ